MAAELKSESGHVEDSNLAVLRDSYAVDENNEPVTVLGTMGQDPNEKQTLSARAWIILILCGVAQFQNTFIGIAPAANAYTIAGALNGMDKRIWIVQAQGIPSIATGPIFAIISDVYGRRYVVLAAWLLFCVASIVAMTAHQMNTLIFAQTLTGVCAGVSGIMFAIASEVVPSVYRSHAQTLISWLSGLAAIPALLGMTGASQADPVNGWRWCFRTPLIINGITLIGLAIFYHPPPRTITKGSLLDKAKTLDWIGYFLLLSGLIPLLMGFAWASDLGWHDKHSYVAVSVGCVVFLICLIWEWKGTSRGFLDHRLFQQGRNFPIALFIISIEGSLFYLINNIYAGAANGLWDAPGTISAGARILPFFMVVTVVSPFMSLYVTKRKDLKWPLCAGFAMFSVCIIGLALSGTNGKLALAFDAIGGLGFCAPLILVMACVQYSVPPLFMGVASALTISARTLGGVVGYGIAEVIYSAYTTNQVPAAIAGAALSQGFNPANLTGLIIALLSGAPAEAVPGVTPAIAAAATAAMKGVQAHAYKLVWFTFLPGTVIASFLCIFLKNPGERMNWVVDAPLKLPASQEHAIDELTHKKPQSESAELVEDK